VNDAEISTIRIELAALSDVELHSLLDVAQEEYRRRRRERESITIKKILDVCRRLRHASR
jgi:hypothetical protein